MNRRQFLSTAALAIPATAASKTTIAIEGDQFILNGRPTYPGRSFEGHKIEGLLMNSRMIQGIYDDENPETAPRWKYKDTGKWDPERNTREFLAAMPEWKRHGLLGIVVGMQGGSPEGYSKAQPWRNSAYTPAGGLKPAYMRRLKKILDRADQLGMVPIVNYFYFGQDQILEGTDQIRAATRETTMWILKQGYRNVIVDLVNECDNRSYDRDAVKAPNVHELIGLVKQTTHQGRRLLVGTSFNGGRVPTGNVVKASDFVILHGNGVKDPKRISGMVDEVRKMPEYRKMPVLFNEDDHFDFDKPENNFRSAIASYAGWGFFDPEGYQSPPVNWGLDTDRKKAYFQFLGRVTGS